jgi:uncharacterized protein YukE
MKPVQRITTFVLGVALAASTSTASTLGDQLDSELKGGWGILEVEVYSGCSGTYSDNEVRTAGVASKAPRRFAAGELVKIDKIKVKRQRIDLMLTLDAPLRVSRMDGPFELYDQRTCQVQLMIFVRRNMVKNADLRGLLSEVKKRISLFGSREEAQLSDAWNGRQVEAFPDDYEETLQRHAAWKAEQTNAAVHRAINHALNEAAEVAQDIDDDEDYLSGFGAGAEKMADFGVTNCGSLLNISFSTSRRSPPADRSRDFEEGWDDGQKLVFYVLRADRLRSCLVPVPVPTLP